MRLKALSLVLPLALAVPAPAPAAEAPAAASASPSAAPGGPAPRRARRQLKREEKRSPARYVVEGSDALELDARADRKREEQIEVLQRIIPNLQGDEKAERLFQLAELWWEKSKFVAHRGIAAYDEALARWMQQASGDAAAGPEPVFETFLRESEVFRQEALRTYEEILRDYAGYGRRDEVLFAYAYNKYEMGAKDEAVAGYEELIRSYPGSRFVADAHVQLGEHAFNTNQLPKARQAYQQALATQNPRIRYFALYKLAWCDFNAGAYAEAVLKFQEVIAHATAEKGGTGLRTEALNDIVLSYARLDAVEEAVRYLEKNAARELSRRLVGKLATQLQDAGRHEHAIRVLRGLINDEPLDPLCPELQERVVDSYEKLRRRDQVVVEMRRMVELYRPGSAWAKANAQNRAALAASYEITEGAMRTLVTDYHQEAQKTRAVETYRTARDLYRDYLESFADSEHAYDLRFYYAEILWALNAFEEAAEQYARVVERDPQGRYSKLAAYDAVLCREKRVEVERGRLKVAELGQGQKVDERKAKGRLEKSGRLERHAAGAQAEAVPPAELLLVEAIDRYVRLYPGAQDEIAVRYKAAFVFYDHRQDLEAARRFGEIIARWPTDGWSRKAADLSLDILNQKQEWLELNRLARAFLANRPLLAGDADFAARVGDLVQASLYKHIDETVYRAKKQPAEAARLFRGFVEEFPRSRYSPQALLYAMHIHAEAVELDLGIELGERLLKEYPDAKTLDGQEIAPRALLALASYYERTGEAGRAADRWERYAEGVLGPSAGPSRGARSVRGAARPALAGEAAEAAADALYNAALWSEAAGAPEHAVALYSRYVDRFPRRPDVPEVFLRIGAIYERQRDFKTAAKVFRAFVEQHGASAPARAFLARYRELLALRELRQEREAGPRLAELLDAWGSVPADARSGPELSAAYAHGRFLAVEPQWREYLAVRFDSVPRLRRALRAKAEMLQRLEKAYTEVLALGAAQWGIASLARVGLAYQDFARNLVESPVPPELNEEEQAMYRGELENRSFPLEEKAIEAYEKAVAKSSELAVYGEWVLLAQDQLNTLRPGTFPQVRVMPLRSGDPVPRPAAVQDAGASR